MKITRNTTTTEVTLTPAELEQAAKEWEGIQKDKPKIGDWVVVTDGGQIRFGKITSIDCDGELRTRNTGAFSGNIGFPLKGERYANRKATEAEVTFFLGLFPDRFKA